MGYGIAITNGNITAGGIFMKVPNPPGMSYPLILQVSALTPGNTWTTGVISFKPNGDVAQLSLPLLCTRIHLNGFIGRIKK